MSFLKKYKPKKYTDFIINKRIYQPFKYFTKNG